MAAICLYTVVSTRLGPWNRVRCNVLSVFRCSDSIPCILTGWISLK